MSDPSGNATDTALRASQAELDRFFAFVPDLVCIASTDGYFKKLSAAWERTLGFTLAELMARPFESFIHPDDVEPTRREVARQVGGEATIRFVNRYRTKAGAVRWLEWVATPAVDGTTLFAAARDITEERQAEEALCHEHAMLARTEGIAHVGSWEWDVASDTVTWSDELFRIFQRDPREGAPSFAEHHLFYPPDDMARLQKAVEAALAEGTPYELELRAIRKDGETRVCVARGIAEMSPGSRAVRLYGSLQDISDRKQAEGQLRALAAHLVTAREEEHTRMAREIHDEFGQGLSALRLDLTWLARRLPKAGAALRHRVAASIALTDEMLIVGQRIVADLRPPILDDLGLVPALEWYVQRFAGRSGIPITLDTGSAPDVSGPLAVTAYRVVQEALTNVVRHAKAKHASVRVATEQGRLLLKIRDDGRGISRKALADPHSFGLLGMRERVASHGGTLQVSGVSRRGTTVRVTMPLPPPPVPTP